MGLYSKIFGKKKTVDTAQPQPIQQNVAAANHGPNAQANMYNDFEIIEAASDAQQVAEVYLNVDTETKSRSSSTMGELLHNQVGHTWLSIKPIGGQLPEDLYNLVEPVTRTLIDSHGETAVGFWPLLTREKRTNGKKMSDATSAKNIEENARLKAELSVRTQKGYTQGSGTITREQAQNHSLHSVEIGRDTDGRVEEPDDTHTPKGRKVYRITRKQFRDMYRYIQTHRTHKYNLYSYNCTTFADHALKAAGQTVNIVGKTMPTSLYEGLYREAKAHEKAAQKAKKRGQTIGKSDVELLKLAEGESHRKRGKDKEGPDGKKVRVKGVDNFEMPMFTDMAEISLKKIADSHEVAEVDKSEFAQLMFVNGERRTLDAVKAYADEAKKINLLSKAEHDAVIKFYTNGFNVLNDLTVLTQSPELFDEYMTLVYQTMPNDETFSTLMDGSSWSKSHNASELTKKLMWNILYTPKTVGGGFENFVDPIFSIASILPIRDDLMEGMKNAILNYSHYRDIDLYRIQYLIKTFFLGEDNVKQAAKQYFKQYFKKRIEKHVLNPKMYQDAVKFVEEAGMSEIIPQKWMDQIRDGVEEARKYNVHSTIFSKTGEAINTNLPNYIPAKKNDKNAPKPDENEIVAIAYLNVDVSPTKVAKGENTSRSSLSTDVGHTWLTLKAKPQNGDVQGKLPDDIEADMQTTATGKASVNIMRAKGETAMGFYPLQNDFINQSGRKYHKKTSEENQEKDANQNLTRQALMDLRVNKGFTYGAGDVEREQTQYTGFSFFKDVTGRVEEPDDAHSPKGRKRFMLTRKQFKQIYQYVEAHRQHKYNLESYNCTTFATHALKAAGHHASGSRFGICYPAKMYRELYNEAKRDARAQRKGNVELLQLAKNESHGEFKDGKTGNGANVRVMGVKRFNMVQKYVDPAEIELRKLEINPQDTATLKINLINSFINFMGSRSLTEATNILAEANRMTILKPKEMDALLYLQKNFANLDNPLIDYKQLPLAKVYDFLTHIKVVLTKDIFTATFEDDYAGLAARLISTPIGSEDFLRGKEVLQKLCKTNFSKEMSEATKDLPLTKELILGMIDLAANYIYNDAANLNSFILKFNNNNNEQAFQFLLSVFREPVVDVNVKTYLVSMIGVMMRKIQNPARFVDDLTALKDDGLLQNAQYQLLYKDMMKK